MRVDQVSTCAYPSFRAWFAVLLGVGAGVLSQTARGQIVFQEQGARLGGTPVGVYWGMSVGDANGDGYEDLLLGRHRSQHPMLALNDGAGAFTIPEPMLIAPLPERDRHTAQWIDFDNDGDKDIYWGSGSQLRHELWQNDSTGLHYADLWLGVDPPYVVGRSRGGMCFDWNADRFLDLFHISGAGETNSRFYENAGGTGVFVDRTAEVGLWLMPEITNFGNGGGGLSDFDNDGDMDFFLCHGKVSELDAPNTEAKFYRQTVDRRFVDVLSDLLNDAARAQVADARWGDYDNDGDMDLYLARGVTLRDYGWAHNGDGAHLLERTKLEFFSRLSPAEGDVEDGFSAKIARATTVTLDLRGGFRGFVPEPQLSEVFLGKHAVNPSAWPIVIQKSDPAMVGEPSRTRSGVYVWFDQQGKRLQFRHTAVATGAGPVTGGTRAKATHPVDLDCDTADDRAAAGPEGRGSREATYQYSTGYLLMDTGQFAQLKLQAMERDAEDTSDLLFRNNGDGTFTDVTAATGIDNPANSVTAAWGDFDNDGDLDLLVVNYHYDVPVSRPFVLYRNDGPAGFVDVTASAGFLPDLHSVITSMAVADFDVDGDLDFAIAHEQGPPPREVDMPRYYVNQGTPNRWLEVRLVGTVSNRDAIGAKLSLTTDRGTQYREQNGGFHNLGQDSMVVHFGTAQDQRVDLTIRWPMGGVQTLSDVPTNQRITVVEPER
ncbi:MAG: CRTAC1 family protein [Planctomycetota bacterium]